MCRFWDNPDGRMREKKLEEVQRYWPASLAAHASMLQFGCFYDFKVIASSLNECNPQ